MLSYVYQLLLLGRSTRPAKVLFHVTEHPRHLFSGLGRPLPLTPDLRAVHTPTALIDLPCSGRVCLFRLAVGLGRPQMPLTVLVRGHPTGFQHVFGGGVFV